MTVWQIASGDGNHDYSKVFLDYGVMLVGPGEPGPFHDNREVYQNSEWLPSFVDAPVEDLVILKRPSGSRFEVVAVGQIAGAYEYLSQFEDVEGWDLQHSRRVHWKRASSAPVIEGLRRGTFYGVNNEATIRTAQGMWQTGIPIPSKRTASAGPES
jgi:hypothetical protein